MAEKKWNPSPEWAEQQIAEYRKCRRRYEISARVLKRILEQAAGQYAPNAIVQTRAKAISSFAEKIHRPGKTCPDPVRGFTDLCGVRVITHGQNEVEAVCRFIEQHFAVDLENSVTISQRLKPTEFGYRSVHYAVQLRPGVFPNREIRVRIPGELLPDGGCPMKSEIQVRTLLEHALIDFVHNLTEKGAFCVPDRWQRELAGLAAMLEGTDNSLGRLEEELRAYAASYGNYLKPGQMRRELQIQEFILKHDPENPGVAHRIARLALELGEWQKAVDVLMPLARSGGASILRDLGVALCKLHRKDPPGAGYRQGQRYLKEATELDANDVGVLASLADTWKHVEDYPQQPAKARARARRNAQECYRKAAALDPADSYALGDHLEYEILEQKSIRPARYMSQAIELALDRCRKHVETGVNLPWAYYDMGRFQLLRGRPFDSLNAYAKAIQLSSLNWMIDSALRSLDALAVVEKDLPGFQWIRRFLIVGAAARFPDYDTLSRLQFLALPSFERIARPIVIVAGGCDPTLNNEMMAYRGLLIDAFRDFVGTVVSGGSTSGICGLVGEVQECYPDRVQTLSYLPRTLPADALQDQRYRRFQRTEGSDFTPLEPLQAWIDLLLSGIMPYQVKLLGINGGVISATEYRIALALGSPVGIVSGSGREASRLLPDENWQSNILVPLPNDVEAVRGFLASGSGRFDPEVRESMATAIHDHYRRIRGDKEDSADAAMVDWNQLPESLKESNRLQADDIFAKLRTVKYEVVKACDCAGCPVALAEDEVEALAKIEHSRWNVERFAAGWKLGEEKNVAHRTTPYLLSWSDLPGEIRKYDPDEIRMIPEFLVQVGLALRRVTQQ